MKEELKYVALIPAYQPNEKLPKIVSELQKNNFEVIVVNDGSDLSYQQYFDECDTKVISYPANRGKGYAIKKGLEYIQHTYKDCIIVTIDSDGQHQISDAINLCEYAKNNRETLVIGKRLRKENMPLRSNIGHTITRFVFELATDEKIYDTQSGLRAFSKELIGYMLEISGDRFEYEMNVLLNLNKRKIKYKEIEIKTIYIDNNKSSKFKVIRDSIKIYGKIIKYKINSILPFLSDIIMYAILIMALEEIAISNIISKLLSTVFYFFLNRKEIFKNKKYLITKIITSISTIILGTLIILLLSNIINTYIAKIITEIILIIVMHKLKKYILKKEIFNNKRSSKSNKFITK